MSQYPTRPKTQAELVAELMHLDTPQKDPKELVKTPGITTLHLKSTAEIGEALANVLKSRANVKSIKYVIGSHIELEF